MASALEGTMRLHLEFEALKQMWRDAIAALKKRKQAMDGFEEEMGKALPRRKGKPNRLPWDHGEYGLGDNDYGGTGGLTSGGIPPVLGSTGGH